MAATIGKFHPTLRSTYTVLAIYIDVPPHTSFHVHGARAAAIASSCHSARAAAGCRARRRLPPHVADQPDASRY
eukprot:scaffold107975_cov63-Phaeocystis_antarctica.AAC.1